MIFKKRNGLSNKDKERQPKQRVILYGLPALTGDRKKEREKERKKIKGKGQDRS